MLLLPHIYIKQVENQSLEDELGTLLSMGRTCLGPREKKCFSTKNHGRAVFRLSLSFKNGVQSADGMGLGSTEFHGWMESMTFFV